MLSYADIEKLEKQGKSHGQYECEYCAMCGRKLWYMDTETDDLDNPEYYKYNYCKKCKVIKSFNTVWTNKAILGKYDQ